MPKHALEKVITFLRVSVSVSVPVDFELTGLRVPSTLSSRNIFSGDGGMMAPAAILDLLGAVSVLRDILLSSTLQNSNI